MTAVIEPRPTLDTTDRHDPDHPMPRRATGRPAPRHTPVAEPTPGDAAALDLDAIDRDALAADLDEVRERVLASLGERDAAYVRSVLQLQRRLEVAGRAALWIGVLPPAWLAGTAMLSLSKILENMEIGHNVMHGQWDWMRDDEIHSTSWEWDNVCPSRQWKHTHNHMHHQWTNVAGRDRDIGYGILRIDASQRWTPAHLAQPLVFATLALLFEYGVGLHDVESDLGADQKAQLRDVAPKLLETLRKVRTQVAKDYVAFPLLSLPFGLPGVVASATGAASANVVRNLWSFAVIFCGHFPDGVRIFTEEEVDGESRGGWYLRQILGSANFDGGPLMHLMTGNLDHQIEHHLFPDLPSNRYAEIAPEVRAICEHHGIPYNTGSFARQFGSVVRKVLRFSLPWT